MWMKYFLNEVQRKASNSTCYHEFFRGKWDKDACVHWNNDSLNTDDDMMTFLELDLLISSVVSDYSYYGVTEINKKQWKEIRQRAEKKGGNLFEAINEVTRWVEENFTQNKVFTILGI